MFYVIDNYTHMVEAACNTEQGARYEKQAIQDETGLFIYSIIKAKDRTELDRIIAEQYSREEMNAL